MHSQQSKEKKKFIIIHILCQVIFNKIWWFNELIIYKILLPFVMSIFAKLIKINMKEV